MQFGQLKRRAFITLLGGAAAWPLAVRAQPVDKVPRIGLVSPFSRSDSTRWHRAFRQGLRDLGWMDEKTIAIEYRYADGIIDRLPELVADLIRRKVDLIVTSVTNDALAAKHATKEIPIVMAAAGDPVATGIVESLAHPGGNITGFSQINPELVGKRLELLKEIVPNPSPMAVLWNSEDPISVLSWDEVQLPARKLGIEVRSLPIRSSGDLSHALDEMARARVAALAIMPNPVFVTNLKQIADFCSENRLPSIFHLREYAEVGGLLSYGVDRTDLFRRAASTVTNPQRRQACCPADPAAHQVRASENLKTARALGLSVPDKVLAFADDVIE